MTSVSKASAFPKSVQSGIPSLHPCPAGWTQEPLGRHLIEQSRTVRMADDQVYDLVTVKRSRGGVVRREQLFGKDISVKSQFRLNAGDFLISKRQIVHGACGIVPPSLDASIVSNEYAVLAARPTIDLEFLNYLAHSIYFQQTCFHSSIGVHVEKMIFKLDRWFKWNFNLPPLPEQRRIADILSTWDQAIEAVENLIATARAQKQALMQQLLPQGTTPPKKRLPGFSGEWRETSLGSFGETYGGLTGKSKNDFGSGNPFITYKNVFENGFVDPKNVDLVKVGAGERQHAIRNGDILFTTSSETPAEVGMSSVVTFEIEAIYLNSFCFGFRPNSASAIRPNFAGHFFRSPSMRRMISALAQGSTRYNISKSALLKLAFKLPEADEQDAIANVLGGCDAELLKLTGQLVGFRQEKTALMQQLLTGKLRVQLDRKEVACA